ncbi:MAG: alpha/beta hydrolase family esterase [Paracoccus sp. (in: a-proteobacteria)]|uniref:alpha/beta hydrolase family esterase n=1 Tax=Paracoccus sp. TaxID=267 RepID=UPI000C3D3537|nr:polyhydroxybutyrate depolymerase [Paracoccus sp. (in: a-proteobacteria)]
MIRRQIGLLISLVMLALALPGLARAGCADRKAACQVQAGAVSGSYHLVLPGGEAPPGGWPAVVMLHGWGSDGSGILAMSGVVRELTGRGYAVIAPDGSPREGRDGRQWLFPRQGRAAGRDEGAFLRAVANDAARRQGLNRARMVLAGFSVGSSMVSYVACDTPGSFAAYAPVGGSFWRPMPRACAGPVRLFHTHGWRDGTVPLEGRAVGGGTAVQGDVFAAMAIWRAANRCPRSQPDGFAGDPSFQIRRWSDCAPGASLVLALHPGGHVVPKGWATAMLDWFEAGP